MLGYQVFAQLEDIYGEKGAQATRRQPHTTASSSTRRDARTAKLFSESLGFEDVVEQRENLSFGAHESRDGVAFMSQRTERPIVTASEIQRCLSSRLLIRFAYDAPNCARSGSSLSRWSRRPRRSCPIQGGGFRSGCHGSAQGPCPARRQMRRTRHALCPELLGKVQEERRHGSRVDPGAADRGL
ncbi:type IV secretion system DNA-binding domain-containing protein [Cereibacter sphaeroides]|uniref:type IV secretion system DNA-binding domain-containing protein n=1 Tax=Cereibacter sphaeroides TaxID=1063 RepID=UPI001F34F00D|nr:type IV secretion system DNA-binding domain-containing protein [Cereibacter sphaeroides]